MCSRAVHVLNELIKISTLIKKERFRSDFFALYNASAKFTNRNSGFAESMRTEVTDNWFAVVLK